MAVTNPVGTYQTQNFQTAADGTTYKTAIDNNTAVGKRFANAFAPHEHASLGMQIVIDAGFVFDGATLTEVAAQTISAIPAPVGNPRIDRIVIDPLTGTATRVQGTEAASPVPPAIGAEKMPCAQILLDNSPVTTNITNALISDERIPGISGGVSVKHKSGANQTVVTTTTETTITAATRTILGGLLGTDNWFDFFIDISDIDNTSGGLTLRAKYGGTTFATISLTAACGFVNRTARVHARIGNDGATNAQRGFLLYTDSGGLLAYGSGTAAQDSTADKDFTFTVQPAINDIGCGLTVAGQHGVKFS